MPLQFSEQEYKSIGFYVLRSLLEFAEGRTQIKDSQSLLDLKSVLETQYTDGITAIPEAYIDGDTITGIFEDQISPNLTKKFNFTVTEAEISYSLANPDAINNFTEFDFAAVAAKKSCPKGTPCGGSCISKLKACRKDNPAGDKVKQIKERVKSGSGSSSKSPEKIKPVDKTKTAKTVKATKKAEPAAKTSLADTNAKLVAEAEAAVNGKSKRLFGNLFGGEIDRLSAAAPHVKEVEQTGKWTRSATAQRGTIEDLLQHGDSPQVKAGKFGASEVTQEEADLRNRLTKQSVQSAKLLYDKADNEVKDSMAKDLYDRMSLSEIEARGKNPESKEIYKDLSDRVKSMIGKGELLDMYGELEGKPEEKPEKKPEKKPKKEAEAKQDTATATSGANPSFTVSDNNKEIKEKAKAWQKEIKEMETAERYQQIDKEIERINRLDKSMRLSSKNSFMIYDPKAGIPVSVDKEEALKRNEKALEDALLFKSSAEEKIKGNRYKDLDPARLATSKTLAGGIASGKTKKIGVVDEKGNLQAVADYYLKKDALYIEGLASAPWNHVNHPNSVKGAGSQAIAQAIKKSQELGKEGRVQLFPLDDALPFYKKLGFKPIKDSDDWELSPEDGKILLDKLGIN